MEKGKEEEKPKKLKPPLVKIPRQRKPVPIKLRGQITLDYLK
jgi:hypothetical protein